MAQYFVGKSLARLLANIAAGAVTMYLVDPSRGKARRTSVLKKTRNLLDDATDVIDTVANDARKRFTGVIARTSRRWTQQHAPVDNRILEARVRSKIGRAIRHPHAVKVQVDHGTVLLSGAVLADQLDWLLNMVRAVPGVLTVQNRIEAHDSADTPSLQGQGRHRKTRMHSGQQNWPPALRAAAALSGSALSYYGLTRRSPAGLLLAAAGIGLVVRSVSNLPPKTRPASLHLQREIHISAPLETVFHAWSMSANFSRFLSHVKEVIELENGRTHWTLNNTEIQGKPLEWEGTLTRSEHPYVLKWESAPHAILQHRGILHFESVRDGTRVDIQIHISPTTSAVATEMASIFGGNPRRQLEQDLMRMKIYIESSTPLRALPGGLPQGSQTLH